MSLEDREAVRDFYASPPQDEWERLVRDIPGRVSYHVHRQLLERFVRPRMRVLEVGAGPGRFTADLVRLGCRVTVTDFSPVQLEANRQRFAGAREIEDWRLLDVCDTSTIPDAAFDAVVAYGGPLSYAFEDAPEALDGLLRVTRRGGPVLGSVMSLLGSWRHFLPGVVDDMRVAGEDAYRVVMATGDLRVLANPHVCKLFRSDELAQLIDDVGAEVLAMSASNWASLSHLDLLAELESDPQAWTQFLEDEVGACSATGALDGGTHILFAATRR